MAKIIARIEKIKTEGALAACLGHLTRERTTLNSDPILRERNSIGVSGTIKDGMGRWRVLAEQVTRKIRKGQVLALEYLFSASPEADLFRDPIQVKEFFKRCTELVEKRHGKAQVVMTAEHIDETTPHFHVVVIPLVDTVFHSKSKKSGPVDPITKVALTAKPFVGSRELLREFQDQAGELGSKFNLDRGIRGSRATHVDVKTFYGTIQGPKLPGIEMPYFLTGESQEEYRAKAKDSVESQIRGPFQILQSTIHNLHAAFHEMQRLHREEKSRADKEKARADAAERNLSVLLKELFSKTGTALVTFVENLRARIHGDGDRER